MYGILYFPESKSRFYERKSAYDGCTVSRAQSENAHTLKKTGRQQRSQFTLNLVVIRQRRVIQLFREYSINQLRRRRCRFRR